MAKLYFKYGAMNSGKTIEVLRTCYNYDERGIKLLLTKPIKDKKGNSKISSRIGIEREVDYLIKPHDDLLKVLNLSDVDVIIVDEVQFLTAKQIDDLWYISKKKDIVVLCYGLRTDFQMKGFEGSTRLLEIADSISEIKTICSCGKKATNNMRFINNKPTFIGDQIAIDGLYDVTYDSVCGLCYLKEYEQSKK